MRCTILVAALIAAAAALAQARAVADNQDAARAVTDDHFVRMASAANLAEVNMAKMALKHSSNEHVKKYAQRLLDDHQKAGKKLDKVADHLRLPVAEHMDAQHEALANRMAALNGDAFDREFVHHMLMDHKKAISLFEAEAKNGKDGDLKAFAEKTLPTLRKHLKMAQDLDKGEKGGGR